MDEFPPTASRDEVLQRLIVDELFWDARVDASKVTVEVTDGCVHLGGHVATVAERFSAEADARMIVGVVTVQNEIQVDEPSIVPDGELAGNVELVLAWTPDIDSSDLHVESTDGTITLRGCVPSYWDKLRAHLVAGSVRGVARVVDELAVVPGKQHQDEEIAENLMQALHRQLGDDVVSVQVEVKKGRVTLRGAVTNMATYRAAQDAAARTPGVVGVLTELTLPHPSEPLRHAIANLSKT